MLNLLKLMLATALTLFSVNASAYLMSEVGSLDTLIGYANNINGAPAEEAWIESIIKEDIEYTQIDIGAEESDLWQFVTDGNAGDVAFDFSPYNPEYYLVKVGNGNGNGTEFETYLYDNLASLQFAYFNLSDFGPDVSMTNIGVISHAGRTGDTTVPEPGVIGLLAIGLLGMGAARRRTNV